MIIRILVFLGLRLISKDAELFADEC